MATPTTDNPPSDAGYSCASAKDPGDMTITVTTTTSITTTTTPTTTSITTPTTTTTAQLFEDTDSAIGDTESFRTTLTESLAPSVMDYRFENGRRYHAYKDGSYALPNDQQELDRLDLQHHLWRLSLDGALYVSPLPPNTNSVLDLGTGTGLWAIEFADENPHVSVTGVDLSPVQPRWIPPNCQFQVDDVEAEWTYPRPPEGEGGEAAGGSGGFDFIHARMLILGLKNWPALFGQSFAYLRPGGWFEAQEFDLNLRYDPDSPKRPTALRRWGNSVSEAAKKTGIDTRAAVKFGDQLRDAGFVDVQSKNLRWPIGPWPESKKEKTLGIWAQRNSSDGLEGVGIGFLSRNLGWSKEKVLDLVKECKEEVMDMDYHQYAALTVWYGRKPGNSSSSSDSTAAEVPAAEVPAAD